MSLGLPSNPSIGDQYTVGETTYEWTGSAWIKVSSSTANATTAVFGTVFVTSTTNAVSTGTGALVVTGGASIGGDLYIGGTLYSSGSPVLTTSSFNATIQDGIDIDIVDVGGGVLEFNNISTLQTVTGRGNSSTFQIILQNTTQSTSTTSGALIISGGIGVGKRVNCESLQIADAVFDSTQTVVNTTATTAIDTYSLTQFRSAKYLVQIDEGIGANADFELREILLVADNNNRVWATEYGVVTSNGDLGTFAAEVSAGNVILYFTAFAATNKTIKVLRTGIAV